MGQYFPAIWTADASIFKQPYLFYGLFENRIIAGLFADSRRMQGNKCGSPFGFRGHLTRHSLLFVE
ncbi:hypothetical protein ANACOL_00862 [Anaerotruncus colihominis DSM 17241]|uniref:Uncharacterized protein n=1 Tax=Anaerotruncus colihominis DSM 17241 TaxID=445972 RepID=B0P7X4_9FIRM|nr:hypothetical protein ANACOL_00862 [Anaerotruncus colihominis DSM 17241]